MTVRILEMCLIVGDIKADVVREAHFGGNFEEVSGSDDNEDTPLRKKTKAEVMQEVISKSKMYKYERQQQHEEDIKEIETLDADLGELQGLLKTIKPTTQERAHKTQEMISYDAMLREMQYDKRSKPTTRTKTEEEIAREEMERLQKLEAERLRRMQGEDADGDDDDAQGRWQRREGDDLDDDFVPDAVEEDFYGLQKGTRVNVDSDQDSDEAGDDNASADGSDDEEINSSDDSSDIAQYFTDEEQDAPDVHESDMEEPIIPATKRLRIEGSTSTGKELAFTFPCPSTFEELLNILKDVPTASIPTVIERIEILHSTKLLAENREKLEVLKLNTQD